MSYGGGAKLRYSRSLIEVATSRVCVDLPGNGPLCFRLVDYMAIGACIIAYPHEAAFPVPLEDRVQVVYMQRDMSDLVDLCAHYARDAAERERLCLASRQYFDQHLSSRQLALYMLGETLRRIGSAPAVPAGGGLVG